MRFSRSMLTSTSTAIMLLCMSGCAYIIPPEQNAPRNNTVEGDMHKPELNNAVVRPRSEAPVQQAPVPIAHAAEPVMAAPVAAAVPSVTIPDAVADNGRRVPIENQSFEVSAAGYPPINTVPARPVASGPGSAQERLTETQSTLELDRAVADERAAALARDAAAEPSMLQDIPALAPMPSVSVPAMNAAPAALPSAVITPAPQTRHVPVMNQAFEPVVAAASVKVPSVSMPAEVPVASKPESVGEMPQMVASVPEARVNTTPTLPNIPVFEPPAPSVMAAASAPREITVAPVAAIQPPAAIVSAPVFVPASPAMAAATSPSKPLRQGDFDPLAVADNAPVVVAPAAAPRSYGTTATNRYIAPSRYYDRRYQ